MSARLQADGLQLADSNQVMQFFHDPRREQDGVIFIDARDDEHYRAGHIPGAYLFDRFQPENYLTNVLQVCLTAQQIVFYCNGGECDDSEHAAIMLRDSIGIPKEKVFVYGGGITEWATNGLPIELGARNSGQFTNLVQTAASAKADGVEAMSALHHPDSGALWTSPPCWRRWLLGGLFIYLGLSKVFHPADFLTVRAAATAGDRPHRCRA